MDEHPHFFYPTLAERLGLHEAIILQQIHSWIVSYQKDPDKFSDRHHHDGHWWIWDTYPAWHNKLPYLSESTIRRTLTNLKKLGLILVGNYNRLKIDRTNWYTIDYAAYDALWADQQVKMDSPSVQPEQMDDDNLNRPLPSSPLLLPTKKESSQNLPEEFPTDSNFSPRDDPTEQSSILEQTDPLSLAAECVKRGAAGRSWTVTGPEGADPYLDGPLTAACTILRISPTSLTEKEQRAYASVIRTITEGVKEGTPELFIQACQAWTKHGPVWKGKTGAPYSTVWAQGFQDDIGILMRQLQSGTITSGTHIRLTND
jgi:hypothetical protein